LKIDSKIVRYLILEYVCYSTRLREEGLFAIAINQLIFWGVGGDWLVNSMVKQNSTKICKPHDGWGFYSDCRPLPLWTATTASTPRTSTPSSSSGTSGIDVIKLPLRLLKIWGHWGMFGYRYLKGPTSLTLSMIAYILTDGTYKKSGLFKSQNMLF
jgi:hypothetical protein